MNVCGGNTSAVVTLRHVTHTESFARGRVQIDHAAPFVDDTHQVRRTFDERQQPAGHVRVRATFGHCAPPIAVACRPFSGAPRVSMSGSVIPLQRVSTEPTTRASDRPDRHAQHLTGFFDVLTVAARIDAAAKYCVFMHGAGRTTFGVDNRHPMMQR